MNNGINQENDGNHCASSREENKTEDILLPQNLAAHEDHPLNGDLQDISGNRQCLYGELACTFVPDPEDPSRQVLSMAPSENGVVFTSGTVLTHRPGSIIEIEFYTSKQETEAFDLFLGAYFHGIIPNAAIVSGTWLKLRLESLVSGNIIQIIRMDTGQIIKEEEQSISSPISAGNPFTIGYCGWKGKTLSGYLRNFRISDPANLIFYAPLTENLTDMVNNVNGIAPSIPTIDRQKGALLEGHGKNTNGLRFDMTGTPYVEKIKKLTCWTVELFTIIAGFPPSNNFNSIFSFGYQYIYDTKNILEIIYTSRDASLKLHLPVGVEKKVKATYDGSTHRIYFDGELVHEAVSERYNPSLSFSEENKYVNNISLCSQAWANNDRPQAWVRDIKIYDTII